MKGKFVLWLGLICWGVSACQNAPDQGEGTTLERVEDGDFVIEGETVYYRGDKPNEVVARITSDPPSLHPYNARNTYQNQIYSFTHQLLQVVSAKTGQLIPQLIVGEPEISDDGLRITYTLDPDAAWSDGTPIVAEDVIFSTKVVLCPHTSRTYDSYLELLTDIIPEPGNARRFTVVFSEYYQNSALFGFFFPIINRHAYDPEGLFESFTLAQMLQEDAAVMNSQALIEWSKAFEVSGKDLALLSEGSGPYTFEEWVPGQRIVLKRREPYWGKDKEGYVHRQHPDRIIYKVVGDNTAMELQLKQQELDVVVGMSEDALRQLEASERVSQHYHLTQKVAPTYTFLALNNRPEVQNLPPIFNDRQVRRATAMALDIDGILSEFFHYETKRILSPVWSQGQEYNASLTALPFDRAQSIQLLEAAGWKDTDGDLVREKEINGEEVELRFSFTFPPNSQLVKDVANFIQAELAKVGMAVELDPVKFATLREKIFQKNFQMLLTAFASPAIGFDFKEIMHTDSWQAGSNYVGYSNPEVDSLIDYSRLERNLEKRIDMLHRIQYLINEDQPMIYLYRPTRKVAVHRRFNHATVYPLTPNVLLNNLQLIPLPEEHKEKVVSSE